MNSERLYISQARHNIQLVPLITRLHDSSNLSSCHSDCKYQFNSLHLEAWVLVSSYIITDHFTGPGRAVGSTNVSGLIFTARRYASTVYAVVIRVSLSVWLSVCRPSVTRRYCNVSERLNLESRKERHTIAQGLQFSDAKDFGETRTGSHQMEAPNAGEVG